MNELVIGTGHNPQYVGQRPQQGNEYTIDIDRRVRPDLCANGLVPQTYNGFNDEQFTIITFEHVHFCPYERADLIHLGYYPPPTSPLYSFDGWTDSLRPHPILPHVLARILIPGGRIIFKTPVISSKDDFRTMGLLVDEEGYLRVGFKMWHEAFTQAGFEMIEFDVLPRFTGWYAQMTAVRGPELKRQKTEPLELTDTENE